jgi:hypothetical protein
MLGLERRGPHAGGEDSIGCWPATHRSLHPRLQRPATLWHLCTPMTATCLGCHARKTPPASLSAGCGPSVTDSHLLLSLHAPLLGIRSATPQQHSWYPNFATSRHFSIYKNSTTSFLNTIQAAHSTVYLELWFNAQLGGADRLTERIRSVTETSPERCESSFLGTESIAPALLVRCSPPVFSLDDLMRSAPPNSLCTTDYRQNYWCTCPSAIHCLACMTAIAQKMRTMS